jgi:hypothetical protein
MNFDIEKTSKKSLLDPLKKKLVGDEKENEG